MVEVSKTGKQINRETGRVGEGEKESGWEWLLAVG
jgi:hypothetical protein